MKFEDIKGVLRSSQSTKDRQYNDQKKSLKMSKEYSEVGNQRKTDNTMTKRKV
jgi:hypothetical protein